MAPPTKLSKQGYKESDDAEKPSNTLWVGNLLIYVTDSDLMDLFARYGALDSVTCYSSRSYAFVFFKRTEDAQAAKNALQGTILRGNPIKIEFARPARPSKQLWVGGIGPTVSKEELEKEFIRFGKIEDFKFLRDRNTAFVDYVRLEDAIQAMRNMNGKRIGGEQIRVDFLRSQPSKREQWPAPDSDGQFQGRSMAMVDSYAGHKSQLHSQFSDGRKGDNQPSNVLWVGYPPSVQIDEQMLHNAMILFGEIERIKSFPSRHYSFVEFRSVDEARRAKEGLQGRLFNDPRITIMYSSSDLAPGKEYSFSTGVKGTRPEIFFNEHPFRPPMEALSHGYPTLSNNFSGLPPSNVPLGSVIRPFGPHGSFEPLLPAPEFSDLSAPQNIQDGHSKNLLVPNWRRLSPSSTGILPSPATGMRPPMRWDALDANQYERESKRSRIDGTPSTDDAFPLRKIDDQGLGMDQHYGYGPVVDGGASGSFVNPGKSRISPVGARITAGGPLQSHTDNDFVWRGIIAKGGTPVCHARCVPVEKGAGSELPEVVNCSARTGLDQLTEHYAEASGFDIVFFLPDSEDDFASYTEFLRYLGGKNRAGVAKFDNGTTMFLVPPSDFLRKVLKVAGPERLYGVVLKFPQVPTSEPMQQQSNLPLPSSHFTDRHQVLSLQAEYGQITSKEEQLLPPDYSRPMHESTRGPPKPLFPPVNESPVMQPPPQEYNTNTSNATSVSQAGVSLTPELIATLASFLPGKTQPSALESAKLPSGPSTFRPQLPPSGKQDHQSSDHTGHSFQQMGSNFNTHGQNHSQYQPYPSLPKLSGHPTQMVNGSSQIQEATVSLPQQMGFPPRSSSNYSTPLENGQTTISSMVNPQYQHDLSHINQRAYGMVHGNDTSGYNAPVLPQSNNTMTLTNQGQGSNYSNAQTTSQSSADRVNSELPNQMQQLQSALLGAGNGTTEVEVDKNQRYQSTLQFAANLLLQIQQQQQQQQQQAGRGSGNQ